MIVVLALPYGIGFCPCPLMVCIAALDAVSAASMSLCFCALQLTPLLLFCSSCFLVPAGLWVPLFCFFWFVYLYVFLIFVWLITMLACC
jgi:hypothetical protein